MRLMELTVLAGSCAACWRASQLDALRVRLIMHHRRQQMAALFVGQRFRLPAAHRGDQRVGGA